jgi:hypothetical protein
MRAFAVCALVLFALLVPAVADDCKCKGCGCQGGSGWRGPDGSCVSTAKLADVCGTPPGAPCKYEGAPLVCPKKQSTLPELDAKSAWRSSLPGK